MMEEPSDSASGPETPKKTFMRIGGGLIVAGVVIGMSAAIAGGANQNAAVLPVRNLAGATMMVGLLMVLAAGRLDALRGFRTPGGRLMRRTALGESAAALLRILPIPSLLALVALGLVAAVPEPFPTVVWVVSHVLIATALLVGVVFARGAAQAFCVGALTPCILETLCLVPLMFTLFERGYGMGMRGYGPTQLSHVMVAAIAWGLMLLAGLVGIAVRALVLPAQGDDAERKT